MQTIQTEHAALVEKYLPQIQGVIANNQEPVLDLACGNGRNGLYLVKNNIPVTFADINDEALACVKKSLDNFADEKQRLANCWQVDFEKASTTPLQKQRFAAAIVFRYLHRPLFEQIKASIKAGGMVIYETFTEQQAEYGRPKNPDFLLKSGELLNFFSDWEVLHSFEGVITNNKNTEKQAIAQLVARKPL